MGRIVITFILTSAFWIWYYSDYVRVEDAVIANIVDNLMEEKESEKYSIRQKCSCGDFGGCQLLLFGDI